MYLPCYLLWPLVTSILTWPKKKFFFEVVGLSTNYQMPFAVCHCHDDSWFSRSDGGVEKVPPARFRAFQSPPGIGLTGRKALRNQYFKWFKRKLETNNQFLKAWQRFQRMKHFEDHFTWFVYHPSSTAVPLARSANYIHSSSLSFNSFTYHYRPFRTEGLAHEVEIYASNADISSQSR